MASYCSYSMYVKGEKENIEELVRIIKSNYNYNDMKFDHTRHLFKMFGVDMNEIEEIDDNVWATIIDGYCSWSVTSCMFSGGGSYYSLCKDEYSDECRGTTIPIESLRLNLDIEIFSEQEDECFQEHYVVKHGLIEISDCIDYNGYCLSDFNSKEEAEEEFDIEITDEEWESEEYIYRGRLEDWNFEI